jgi:RNA polymerase sigma-70 factor (ECF subfamily)
VTGVGDLPGLNEIFREHHGFVWRVVRRLGVPTAAVDDAVQEVFVVLHRRRAELELTGSLRGLLYGIARRVAKRQRDRAAGRPALTLVEPSAGAEQEQRVELEQKAAVVRDALDAMDVGKRMAFLLVDVEGMSVPEVASCQGVNLNTAYARLRAARRLVQKAIARHRAKEDGRVRAGAR